MPTTVGVTQFRCTEPDVPDPASCNRFCVALLPLLACFSSPKIVRARQARNTLCRKEAVRNFHEHSGSFSSVSLCLVSRDFSRTFLIWLAARALDGCFKIGSSVSIAVLLYTLHNLVSAAAAYPIGRGGDRMPKIRLLALGYWLGVGTNVVLVLFGNSLGWLVLVILLRCLHRNGGDAGEGCSRRVAASRATQPWLWDTGFWISDYERPKSTSKGVFRVPRSPKRRRSTVSLRFSVVPDSSWGYHYPMYLVGS
jgi:hypothetical protein